MTFPSYFLLVSLDDSPQILDFTDFFVFQAQKPHSITNSSISPNASLFGMISQLFFSVAIWNTAGVSPHFRLTTHDRLLDSSRLCVSHNSQLFFISIFSNAELVVEQTKVLLRPANSYSKMITREMWHSNYQFFLSYLLNFFSLTEECDDDEVDGWWRNVCKSWICRESSDKEQVFVRSSLSLKQTRTFRHFAACQKLRNQSSHFQCRWHSRWFFCVILQSFFCLSSASHP